jgi:hypothetical protein
MKNINLKNEAKDSANQEKDAIMRMDDAMTLESKI